MLQKKKKSKPHGKDPVPSKQRAERLGLGGLKDIQFKGRKPNKKGDTAVTQRALLLHMK